MTDNRTPPQLDFFSEIVNVHWPAKEGRILLDCVIVNDRSPTSSCVAPSFTLGEATLLDSIELCRQVTIPEKTTLTTFYFVWIPQLATPTVSDYNISIPFFPVPYDTYASQMPFVFGYPNRPPGAPDPPGISSDPSQFTEYINAVNAELAAHPGGSFEAFNTDLSEFNFIATVVQLQSVTVPITTPQHQVSTLRAKYLVGIPELDTGEVFEFSWFLDNEGDITITAKSFRQNVSKISQLRGQPDNTWVEEWDDIGTSTWTSTTTMQTTKKLFTTLQVEGGGGGGG
jgi:hypothetical protein